MLLLICNSVVMEGTIRSLADDSDEELENIMQIYIMFEYTNLLKQKPQPQRTSKLRDMNGWLKH